MRQKPHDPETQPSAQTPTSEPKRDGQGRVLQGNQLARKYPRPALEDPAVQHQLACRREQIIVQRGGLDRLSAMEVGNIERFVVLEGFVTSWESYFMKSSPISRQGRVRSGYREGYLSSLDRLMKLGAQIGVERITVDADLLNLSAADYASQTHPSEGGQANDETPGSIQETGRHASTRADHPNPHRAMAQGGATTPEGEDQ